MHRDRRLNLQKSETQFHGQHDASNVTSRAQVPDPLADTAELNQGMAFESWSLAGEQSAGQTWEGQNLKDSNLDFV